jgi:class 3 adenylate cyclase/tetratricopeptide (TPR) repeat protein
MALITMVFTDVVGSSATKRDTSLGRDARERDHAYLTQVQTPHFELVRACCNAHGGREVSTMGDAFFLAFDDPAEAVRCAVNIQQKLTATPIQTPLGPLRLRIGIHSGFPEFFEGSWHGTDVDTTARVEAAATEQQILISARTYEITRDMTDAKFYSCGEFALKGVGSIALWEVDWDGNGPRRPAALPLAEARRRRRRRVMALGAAILVVVSAGYGEWRYVNRDVLVPVKRRQSVAVLGFKNLGGADEAWLADAVPEMLSTELGTNDALRIISPEDVSTTKADLSIAMVPMFNGATLLKIGRILHSQYVISGAYVARGNQAGDSVHIDVHLQDANSGEAISSFGEDGTIATLSEVLRRAAEKVRNRLGVQEQSPGSNAQAKPALPSDPEALRDYSEGVAKLRRFDALGARGLLESSIALEPNFALVHWALARTWQLLGYDEKARAEVKRAMELSVDLPPRDQRTIEAENYELNAKWDQAIAIYQALCVLYRDEPNYPLALANAQTSAGKGQEAMGTLEKLGSQPEMKDDPRVDLFVALAAESLGDPHKQRDAAQSSAEKAQRQESRLLAAHAYWQLCSAYFNLGEFQKGEAACNSSDSSAPFDNEIKARTQTVLANIMFAQGQTAEALEMRRQALDTARRIGSQKDVIGALHNLANVVDLQGDTTDARRYFDEAFRIAQDIDDKQQLLKLQNDYAADLYGDGDFTDAEGLYRKSLGTARQIDDQQDAAMALQNLSLLLMLKGDLATAQEQIEQAIAIQRQKGLQGDLANSLVSLGDLLVARGDFAEAHKSYEESLKLATDLHLPAGIAASRSASADLALAENEPSKAEALAKEAADAFKQETLIDQEADARNLLAKALLAASKISEAQAEINAATRLAPQDRTVRLAVTITAARLKARSGNAVGARKDLEVCMADAARMKLVGTTFEIGLAEAEVLRASDPKSALAQLQALQKDAKSKGYLRVAADAERARRALIGKV